MADAISLPVLTERFDRALVYANALHRMDRRKQTTVPYIAHLFGVCSLVLENGGCETEAIAALLHDAAEDHGGEPQLVQIASRFGHDVAQIVRECSDSLVDVAHQKKGPWFERKRAYLEHLRAIAPARPSSLLVSAADKLYNVRSIDADAHRPGVGEAVYERFSGKRLGTLWYYRELADVLTATPGRHELLAEELAAFVERLSGGKTAGALFAAYDHGRASLAVEGRPQS
jgi:(p)ppGpp synthase/HD superfamily hydrolase